MPGLTQFCAPGLATGVHLRRLRAPGRDGRDGCGAPGLATGVHLKRLRAPGRVAAERNPRALSAGRHRCRRACGRVRARLRGAHRAGGAQRAGADRAAASTCRAADATIVPVSARPSATRVTGPSSPRRIRMATWRASSDHRGRDAKDSSPPSSVRTLQPSTSSVGIVAAARVKCGTPLTTAQCMPSAENPAPRA